nr:reverse transcriptase domain, reverse transcriptase zinc-binding domain protein [Tanacetum cinerariifolium]
MELAEMARWMGFSIGEFPFTYLGLPIGENMRRKNAWNPVVQKFKKRLADWKAKTMSFEDRLTWTQVKDDMFKVRELTRLVEEKILHAESGSQDTILNKLVPKKVNIFVWRARKGKLLVRVELDRICIDLDSILCPSCNNVLSLGALCS